MASSKLIIKLLVFVNNLVALVMLAAPNNRRALMRKLKFHESAEESCIEFQAFAKKFNKTYSSFKKIKQRYNIFHDNNYWIKIQNQISIITKFAVIHFADLINEEFRKNYFGYKDNLIRAINYVYEYVQNVADSFDWEQKGAVTPIKDQDQCGSCWAFSSNKIEGAYFIKTGQSYGEDIESDYPYTGVYGNCKQDSSKAITVLTNFVGVPNKAASKNTANGRVVSSTADISNRPFCFGDIYNGQCSASASHGVNLSSYGTE